MPTFVALLRGVNVGGHKRVPMADWRALMAEQGYTHVRTLLNSGNAVFDAAGAATPAAAARHARALQEMLATRLRVEVPVVVKTAAQVAAIVAGNEWVRPFAQQAMGAASAAELEFDASRLLVAFAPDAAALAGLAPIAGLVQPPERFLLGRHAAYLHCASGILQSRAGEALLASKAGGTAITTRNWATTLKLQAMALSGEEA